MSNKKRIMSEQEAGHIASFASLLPNSTEAVGGRRRHGGAGPTQGGQAREEAFRDGFASGYDAGFEKGMLEALQIEDQRLEQFTLDLRSIVRRIEEAMDLWFQKAEHGLSQLSIEIARKIVVSEIEQRPEAILAIVKDALGRVQNSPSARVRVNPFDLQTLEPRHEALIAACQTVHELEIVADDSLSRGSTVVESEGGVIDARVESKLANLLEGEAA